LLQLLSTGRGQERGQVACKCCVQFGAAIRRHFLAM
jgi:hypothetical protein